MKKLILLIALFQFLFSFGQNTPGETIKLINDSIRGGELNIEIDSRLSSLVNYTENRTDCPRNEYVPPRKLTPAEKCLNQNKIMGYKIQIFYTKDRTAAEKVKNDFAKQYPGFDPELIYLAPDYRILIGDYFTRKSAGSDLRKIQRNYPGAFTVQWRVWCRKAI